ncbi:methyltransferase, FxLD system [Nonomuraea sp. NPDC050790]|uniref:methyltransferase, FxLD system n=1 Tax=Nonomuraea sp. NPDC050790 TaxID=3364371 RepID=UPI0037A9BAB5
MTTDDEAAFRDAMATADTEKQAAVLRDAMVEKITARHKTMGWVFPAAVERALRTVPRHLFTGDADLQVAYEDNAIVTKRNERGTSLSSVSAPWLQAMMLGQADLKPGDRVLEVGSGGYNAALIQKVVGPTGSVTTIDIDPEVTDRAQRFLADTGYGDIEVICADAEFEVEPGRTFDAIIVTVGSWDVPPAWPARLAEGGRLVVPLRTWGMTRSWVLERQGDGLVSRDHQMCGFVAMQGAGAHQGTATPLFNAGGAHAVGLWRDEQDTIDAEALSGVLDQPRVEVWTGITVEAATRYSDQDLWLATSLPAFSLMTASQQALDDGLVALPWRYGTPAFVNGPNLAYRPKPRPLDGDVLEFGAFAHGPQAEQTAQRLADAIAAWDAAGRPSPRLSVHPADTPDAELPDGHLLDKKHTRLVISWPPAR